MIQDEIRIQAAAGNPLAFVHRPDGDGPWPGVIMLTDIGGIRQAYHDSARRLASEGYVVLLPNVFYRTSEPPVIVRKPGVFDDAFWKRFKELTEPLTPEAIESDAAAYVGALSRQSAVRPGPVGVVGHCYTGGVAMRVAAAQPDKVAAAASFHGGGLYTDSPTSPHLLLPRIRARLYFGYAVKDNSMPEEAIRKFETALAAWGGQYQSETYEGAYHSWTALDSPVYNQPQAERAFGKLTELLAATLR